MTPRVLAKRVLVSQRTIIELSEGTGFNREPIYGVSVLAFDADGKRVFTTSDKSAMFYDLAKAKEYYNGADTTRPA